jgi:hypothetical protein
MNPNLESSVQRLNERGQTLVLVPLILVVLLSICALVIDMGNIYVCYQELQSSTQAAALAGGEAIPLANSPATDPTTIVAQYSGSTAMGALYNIHPNLNITSVTTNLTCVQPSTYPNLGLPSCNTYYIADGSVNVIQVTEKASVPTYFAKLFGVTTVPISATATASAKGGGAPPYHIVMILDSTPSMQQAGPVDTGCIASNPSLSLTPIQCAEQGIQTLLSYLNPCSTTSGQCAGSGTPGVVTNAVDQVALMTFPGLQSSETTTWTNPPQVSTYATDEYKCPPTGPPVAYYNSNPAYLILPFQSDYRSSDTVATLNGTTSNLVKAVGATTDGNCTGIHAVNQAGTFYAGVIDSAQAYLAANSTPSVQNIMVLLSDGDAACNTTSMGGTAGGPHGVYPATTQCQQAITEADIAKAAGTLIYSVAYGSKLTGCATDKGGLTPCQTMEQISSSPTGGAYFFSVPSAGVGTLCTGAVPITQLYQVFTTIAGDLTTSRLVPNAVF